MNCWNHESNTEKWDFPTFMKDIPKSLERPKEEPNYESQLVAEMFSV
jgi:hypothetical protein